VRAVVIGEDRRLQATEIDRPAPGPGEALVEVRYCGICGSDLHLPELPAEWIPAGHVLGHELTGMVAALGPQAGDADWAVGERVTVFPMVACEACGPCRAGHPNLCDHGIDSGPGIGRQGGYAEAVTVPVSMLRSLPDAISDADGALIEPLAVAIRAIRRTGITPGEPVCVLGAGPIGALAVAGLHARGVDRVAVVEPAAGRRAAASRLGAPAVTPDEAVDRIPALLGGEPPAAVIDCTGHPAAAPLAIELLPAGGRLTIAGLPGEPSAMPLDLLAVKELVVRGSLVYTEEDFAEALGHIAAGRIPCDQLITTVAPLDQAADWFADLTGGATDQVKVLLQP
jgi:(R,R)-butanediol dehydrogenase / meso-butanediol dehydrogenase / diacetyl reductase